MKRYASLLLVVGLAGCSWFGSSGDASRVPRGATAYKCDGGKELYVRYLDGGKSAMVIYPEREFRLDAEQTGSGVLYTNGRTILRTKGAEATLEEGSSVIYSNCKSVR